MNCPFCFGTKRNGTVNMGNIDEFFMNLRQYGVKNIVLTGGEPSLADNFANVVSFLKKCGFNLALSTNGVFWNNDHLKKTVIENISWIALPVDSTDPVQHNFMRGAFFDHHSCIHKILGDIPKEAPDIKVKIGTVASKENLSNISGILHTLPMEPALWKIYQLSEVFSNSRYYKENKISDSAFEKLVDEAKKENAHRETRITCLFERDRERRYLFLEPDGTLMTIENNKEVAIGDCRDDFRALIKKIELSVDVDKINSNFNNSFIS